jgi:glycerol transport system ATP-binding protein
VLPGVHEYQPGHVLDAVLDPDNVFVFDAAGRLVASPGPVAFSSEVPSGSREENASTRNT